MAKTIEQSLAFCPICSKTTMHFKEVNKISWLMHLVLIIITGTLWLWVLLIVMLSHVMSIPIGRSKVTCSQCGGLTVASSKPPIKHNSETSTLNSEYREPQSKVEPIPELLPDLPPAETFAIERNINGGLIEFFGLHRWYQATFDDEQKHRLEDRFGTVSGNKLASGSVRFKFANVDALQFLYELEEKLKPKAYKDVYMLVDEQFKMEAGKFCKIDDDRWDNEKYYKSWFALMKYRIDALSKLKKDNYFKQGQFDAIDDNCATKPCLDISGKGFNILNGELDRAFDNHFFEPIDGCRCAIRGYRD